MLCLYLYTRKNSNSIQNMSLAWFKQTENILVVCLVLLIFGLHLHIINQPSAQILDEQHYVPEANSIIDREGLLHPEHPSLGKLITALGILIFDNNSVGWRIFPNLFGVVSIILFYFICKKLTKRKYVPIIATCIFAFENMSFVQSSVAMLDVYSLTFMLASFLLFLHSRYISSGIALALGATAKLTGAFGVIAILIYWLLTKRKPKRDLLKFVLSAPLAFMALMPLADWVATGDLLYPWDRIDYMIDTHSTLTFASTTHGSASHPWEWIIYPEKMAFWYHPSYDAAVSWTVWGLIIPAIGYAAYMAIRKHNHLCLFSLLWIASTYLIWIPIDLIKDRVMFVFYFYPTVGAICLILGLGISSVLTISRKRKSLRAKWTIRVPVAIWGISHVVIFLFMAPVI